MTAPFSKIGKNKFSVVGIAALSLLLAVGAFAQRSDKATVLTFNEPVEIPGSNPQVLPAGTYLFKVIDSKSTPHIVQISDKEESMVYSTVMAVPAYRDATTRDTVVTFQERGTARPQAIEKWFYPNDVNGEEFVYSRTAAQQPQVAAATPRPPVTQTPTPAPAEAAPPAPAPAPAPEPTRTPEPEAAAAPPPAAPEPTPQAAAEPAPQPAPEATRTPEPETAAAPPPAAPEPPQAQAATPTPEPTPATPAPAVEQQPQPQAQTQQADVLPRTASNLPMVLLAGVLAIGTGLLLRRLS